MVRPRIANPYYASSNLVSHSKVFISVTVAKWLRSGVVIPVCVGSIPTSHPNEHLSPRLVRGFFCLNKYGMHIKGITMKLFQVLEAKAELPPMPIQPMNPENTNHILQRHGVPALSLPEIQKHHQHAVKYKVDGAANLRYLKKHPNERMRMIISLAAIGYDIDQVAPVTYQNVTSPKDGTAPVQQLVAEVLAWVNNGAENHDSPIIAAATKQYKYSGPLYRLITLYDNGSIPRFQGLAEYVRSHERAVGLASWSKSAEGSYRWADTLGSLSDRELEFEDDEHTALEVLCAQKGTGFDVRMFVEHLKSLRVEVSPEDMELLQRAADVEEVIAPWSATIKAEVKDTHRVNQ